MGSALGVETLPTPANVYFVAPNMVASLMMSSSVRRSGSAAARLSVVRRSMATVQSRIGDKKVEMSNLEKGRYINYQRIEDNLQVVRSR